MRNRRWHRAGRLWVDSLGGMPENASEDFNDFRWRNNDGDESDPAGSGATFKAAQGVNLTGQDADNDTVYRLRCLLEQVNTAHDQSDVITPRLNFKLNTGGTFAIIPGATLGTEVEMVLSQLVDGNNTTNDNQMTFNEVFFTAPGQEEIAGQAAAKTWANAIKSSIFYEWSFQTLAGGLSGGDTLFFRVTNVGNALDAYSVGDLSDVNPVSLAFVSGPGPTGPPIGTLASLGAGR